MKSKLLRRLVLFVFAIVLLPYSIAFGEILDSWSDMDAYKPAPILFLHGFAVGAPESWDKVINGFENTKGLKEYFAKYTPVTSNSDLSSPYLERIAFNDPNGSIDTYPPGKLNLDSNSDGWADKINIRINSLLPLYRFKNTSLKFNLVCHSMGGLAAREYAANNKYGNSYFNIDKIITIGTPHAGTPLATVKKIEDAILGTNKYVWEVPWFGKTRTILETAESGRVITYIRGEYKIDFDGEAIKDMAIGSQFLMTIKEYPWPANIKKFTIYGKASQDISMKLNKVFFSLYYPGEPFTSGDGIVPRDSQKGYDIMSDYPNKSEWVWIPDKIEDVNADHFTELESGETVQKILSFLDSTKPELEITSPDPITTTEIHETSINIQGKVFKEYLPADSKLFITVQKQEDGSQFSLPASSLKPSDLWVPNDPGSPVAEFNEGVSFPGNGTYKISCQVKNPAGIVSETKDVWVKVSLVTTAQIIVHCHNPEGKEINSISEVGLSAEIYDGDNLIGYGAHDEASHNQPIAINTGNHTIKAKFNGITMEQNINLNLGETQVLTFTFTRRIWDFMAFLNTVGGFSQSNSFSVTGKDGDSFYAHLQYAPYPAIYIEDSLYIYIGDKRTITVSGIVWGYFTVSAASITANLGSSGVGVTPPDGQFSLGTAYLGGIRFLNVRVNEMIINPPNFTNWYKQTEPTTNVGEEVKIYITDLFGAKIQNNTLYTCVTLPLFPNILINLYKVYGGGQEATGVCTIDKVKISSVPYDITGTAI